MIKLYTLILCAYRALLCALLRPLTACALTALLCAYRMCAYRMCAYRMCGK
jgi:hypothetical protein